MKHLATFILVGSMLIAGSAAAQRRRAVDHPASREPLQTAAESADDPRPWYPGNSVSQQWIGEQLGAANPLIRLRFSTRPTSVPRMPRDFTDTSFLALHKRYADGNFTVKVWRNPRGTSSYCVSQSALLPAQPNQEVTLVLSIQSPTDLYYFELWPGYDVAVDAQVSGVWRELSTAGLAGETNWSRIVTSQNGTCP